MHRRKHVDAEMDERNEERAEYSEYRRVTCAQRGALHGAPQDQVRDVDEPEKKRRDETNVPPRPIGPPDRFCPEWAGNQNDRREDHAHLRRALGETIEPLVTEPQIDSARDRDEPKGEEGYPGGGYMDVKDFLRSSLPGLERRKKSRADNTAGHSNCGESGKPGNFH